MADGVQVDRGVFLREGFTATGSGRAGAVRLTGARIGGRLDCTGAKLSNDSGPALMADGLQVDQSVFLRDGFMATGSGDLGAVRLLGAQVGGQFDCDRAELSNDSGPALHADSLRVDRGVFLRHRFNATGSGGLGAVRLVGAHIGVNLECNEATMSNDCGPALNADSLQVGQGVWLRGGFTAAGSGDTGAVRLSGAHIGGSLDCGGAKLRNKTGSALMADGLQVGQDMLCDRLAADGGVVLGGHIGRLLSFEGAALNNSGGFALFSDGLRVDGTMFCRNGFTAHGEVRLPGAASNSQLFFNLTKAWTAGNFETGRDMAGLSMTWKK